MGDKNQNNINQAVVDDVKDTASASPSSDSPKLELAEEYLNNWKRERADFVNYKKDEGKRMGDFVKLANESLVLEMIDVYDGLISAFDKVTEYGLKNDKITNSWVDGLLKIGEQFRDVLKKYGIEKIEIGDKFDPMSQEVVEGTEGDKIEEVIAGYTMYGKVIRPARVKIVK